MLAIVRRSDVDAREKQGTVGEAEPRAGDEASLGRELMRAELHAAAHENRGRAVPRTAHAPDERAVRGNVLIGRQKGLLNESHVGTQLAKQVLPGHLVGATVPRWRP